MKQLTRNIKSAEIIDFLNNIPIFDTLSYRELKIITRYMHLNEIDAGKILFNEGEKGEYVCFFISGTLEIVKKSQQTNYIVLSEIGRGRSIGEMAIIDDYPRSATVRTKTKTLLIFFLRDQFNYVLKEYPEIGIKILKGITRLISLNLRKASSRLADYMMPIN